MENPTLYTDNAKPIFLAVKKDGLSSDGLHNLGLLEQQVDTMEKIINLLDKKIKIYEGIVEMYQSNRKGVTNE